MKHFNFDSSRLNNESTEILLRRAADLAFLFQNYEFAYNFYHAAKRDFSREQNPPFYAGLLVKYLVDWNYFLFHLLIIVLLGNVLFIEFYARIIGQ